MDSNKTPEEELAAAQAAFAAAQERLNAARQRVGQSGSADSPFGPGDDGAMGSSAYGDASTDASYDKGPFVVESEATAFGGAAQTSMPYGAQTYAGQTAQQTYANPQTAQQQAAAQQQYAQSFYGSKDHVAAGLLAIFLGWLGLHKFYLGYNTQGFILLGVSILGGLFTFTLATWVVWIISFVEGVIYLSKNQTEFDQLYVKGKREWF